ncbi:hypothetical protein FLACOL7796_00817 [Flavobacterium collinsii]|uniref:Uncharacterized protein n=1 Tax=Flavobacterium collinsii TaxID=1114861 RepID=A0ABM8KEX0_9FLAO|nr:hypothetical protein FLACOL7796_00817 [Flavobacterium collinsii]
MEILVRLSFNGYGEVKKITYAFLKHYFVEFLVPKNTRKLMDITVNNKIITVN